MEMKEEVTTYKDKRERVNSTDYPPLPNPPLVEAIFELKWEWPNQGGGIDPNYMSLFGRMYEQLKKEYPHYEQLPTASMPYELANHIVQHRFRKEEDKWPLVQLGRGIVVINDVTQYVWDDFEKRICQILEILFKFHSDTKTDFQIESLMLRYIDSVGVDYTQVNILDFLRGNLKLDAKFDQELFKDTGVKEVPFGVDLNFSLPSEFPLGALHLRFRRGLGDRINELMWETIVQSRGEHVPTGKKGIIEWAKSAHALTHKWFFKAIEGELRERFEK